MKRLSYLSCMLLALLFTTNNVFAQDSDQPKKLRKIYLWDVTASMDMNKKNGGYYEGTYEYLIKNIKSSLDGTRIIILPFNDYVIEEKKVEFDYSKATGIKEMNDIATKLIAGIEIDMDDKKRQSLEKIKGLDGLGRALVSNHDKNYNDLCAYINNSDIKGFTNVVAAVNYATKLRNENVGEYNTDVIILTDGNHEYYKDDVIYSTKYKLSLDNGKLRYSDTGEIIAVNGGDNNTRQLLLSALLDGWCGTTKGSGDKLWYVITNESIESPFEYSDEIPENIEVISQDEMTAQFIEMGLKDKRTRIGFNDNNTHIRFYVSPSYKYGDTIIKIKVKGECVYDDNEYVETIEEKVYSLNVDNMYIDFRLDGIVDKSKLRNEANLELTFEIDNKDEIREATNTNLSFKVGDKHHVKIINGFLPVVNVSIE